MYIIKDCRGQIHYYEQITENIPGLCIFYLENAVLSYANKIHVAFVATEAIFSLNILLYFSWILSFVNILVIATQFK